MMLVSSIVAVVLVVSASASAQSRFVVGVDRHRADPHPRGPHWTQNGTMEGQDRSSSVRTTIPSAPQVDRDASKDVSLMHSKPMYPIESPSIYMISPERQFPSTPPPPLPSLNNPILMIPVAVATQAQANPQPRILYTDR
jgi:hypothetical protein